MPAIIKTLHDIQNNIVYPDTVVTAVHMPDGHRTLLAELEEFEDGSNVTTFNADGSITKTMTNSGMVITTEFGDGVITDTCVYPDETVYYTQTTTFNEDGSITVEKVYADNSEYEEEDNGGGE